MSELPDRTTSRKTRRSGRSFGFTLPSLSDDCHDNKSLPIPAEDRILNSIFQNMSSPSNRPLLILIAGPYRSNTNDDPSLTESNYRRMNEVALELFRKGHLPITGEAIALPLIQVAGSQTLGDAIWNEMSAGLFLDRRSTTRTLGVNR
jgi:hypothetical protein